MRKFIENLNQKFVNEQMEEMSIEVIPSKSKFLVLKFPQTNGAIVLDLIEAIHSTKEYNNKILWLQTSFATKKEAEAVFDKLLTYDYQGSLEGKTIFLQNQEAKKRFEKPIIELKKNLEIADKYEFAVFEQNDNITDLNDHSVYNENLRMVARNAYQFKEFNIEDLPITADDYKHFTTRNVKIIGEIIADDSHATKKSFLVSWKVTNYKDTISVSGFFDKKPDFKIGDTLSICGFLRIGKYSGTPEIQITQENEIERVQSIKPEKATIKKYGRQRVELNVSTKMSQQDAVSTLDDYYAFKDDYELKAIGVADHENIFAFPHAEAIAENNKIKMMYGVKLNCLDIKNFKVFYKGTSSKNNVLVGVDIETTGLSNQYDEITEISAYKVINGELKEYSVLVKLDDYNLLRDFIIQKTSITKEMLEEEGIELYDALKGFVDFVDDGILVAHNGLFDKDFLEAKILKVLGIKKDYSLIDTMNLSRVCFPEKSLFDLEKCAKMAKVDLVQHHRAIYDAICCYQICLFMLDKLSCDNVTNCENPERTLSIKSASKKSFQSFKDYLEENNIQYKEYNNSKTSLTAKGNSTTRINVTFEFKNSDCDTCVLENVIQKADEFKLKIVSDVKRNPNMFKNYDILNAFITPEIILKFCRSFTVNALVQTQEGLKNLYKIISRSNTNLVRGSNVFVTEELLEQYHKGILYSVGGINSRFRTVLEKGIDKVDFAKYDFVEIHPVGAYRGAYESVYLDDCIKDSVRKIVEACEFDNIPVVATSNAYYATPDLKEYRKVFTKTFTTGNPKHYLFRMDEIGDNHLRSTSEMVAEMNKYGFSSSEVNSFVFDNPDKIYDSIDSIKVVHKELSIPKNDFLKGKVLDIIGHEVPDVVEEMKSLVYSALNNYKYNGVIPSYVLKRAERELNQVISAGYYVTYYLAYLLVKKSNSDGYVVGSRGSVGSSFVANLMGITEVNALVPHYLCPNCHYSVFQNENEEDVDDDSKKLFVNLKLVQDGFDLPRCRCPKCKTEMLRDGHDIPFETFLGFNGDKVPDIDLNFSGDYQETAMKFIRSIFGRAHAFRVGTIGTVADGTAKIYYKKYLASLGITMRNEEIERKSHYLVDAKRTTGQHAGGVLVVPKELDIFDFTPVQYPANDVNSEWLTTHYDYHGTLDEALLKLDILGHDDPTILKFLMDMVHQNPEKYPFSDVKGIPLLTSNDIQKIVANSTAISELGTNFVKGMLSVTKPSNFGELVKVSGLSHGTDVYNNNAEALVSGTTEFGEIPFSEVIGCRDDIMVYLLKYFPEQPKTAFDIMEFVRKGKAQKEPAQWDLYKTILKNKGVPDWYIWSCGKIQYMFPKAHAVAYVHSALRIAWFKLYRPLEFWNAYFSVRSEGVFDAETILSNDIDVIQSKINEINELGYEASPTDINKITYYEGAIDCLNTGIHFEKPDINKSLASHFVCDFENNALIIPFSAINGVGTQAGLKLVEERNQNGNYTLDDFITRTKAGKKVLEGFDLLGVNYKNY